MERNTELTQIALPQNTSTSNLNLSSIDEIKSSVTSSIQPVLYFAGEEGQSQKTNVEFGSFASEDSPLKLDPLSREFPSSIPSNNHKPYIQAKEELFFEESRSSIVTSKDDYKRSSTVTNRKTHTGDSNCKCLIF